MSPNRASAVAMVLWLIVQIGALALSAYRIPLSILFPPAAEQLALGIMLVAQIGMAALLAPLLLHSRRNTVIAIVAGWPMAQLAGMLADAPAWRVALAEAYVSVWILTLGLWVWAVGKTRFAPILPAAAAAISWGGPILWYLHAEFVTQSDKINWATAALLGPLMGALSQVVAERPVIAAWWVPAALIPLAFLAGALTRLTRQEKNLTTGAFSPQQSQRS
jgi:hypothetical protein